MDIIQCALQHFVGDFARLLHAVHNFYEKVQYDIPVPPGQNHTGDIVPYSFRTVRGFFKGAVSRNSAKLGNYKMPVKLRET